MLGISQVADEVWLVDLKGFDLGFYDKDKGRVERALSPFAPEKVSTMSPV